MLLARSAISRGIVAEKNSVWRLRGSLVTILRMSWMKPMSSMRSASSSTNTSTRSSVTARCCMRSSRRPGVATSTSTPWASVRIWRPIGTPPMASVTLRAQIVAVGLEALDDLRRQLARRAQHQHAAATLLRPLLVLGEVIEDRQREGRGLAGAGLGDADDVAGGEHLRDGLGLDRGGSDVLLVDEGASDRLRKAEFEKGGQRGIFHVAKRPAPKGGGGIAGEIDTPRGLGCHGLYAGCDGSKTKTWNSFTRPANGLMAAIDLNEPSRNRVMGCFQGLIGTW